MDIRLDHFWPKEWIESLSEEELKVLQQALEQAMHDRLRGGARFDFFGGATLDLDSVFVSPSRGDDVLEFFEEAKVA